MSTTLVYNVTRTIDNGKHILTAKIMLGDECKNGHQDFSVTGEVYETGKPRIDRYLVTCGAIGDLVAQHCPDLKMFCDLHLCDYSGAPMHALANMYFHLHNKFNAGHAVDSLEHKQAFMEYYRITPFEFGHLSKADSQMHFAMLFRELPIASRWATEAKAAIAKLEELTGKMFENNSTRSNLVYPSDEDIAREEEKIRNGFYTPEAIADREAKRLAKKREQIIADAEERKAKIDHELAVKLAMFDAGGESALENTIFYSHTNKIKFNWRGYGKGLSQQEIDSIKRKAVLPDGVSYEN
jgi:hypothetical protein